MKYFSAVALIAPGLVLGLSGPLAGTAACEPLKTVPLKADPLKADPLKAAPLKAEVDMVTVVPLAGKAATVYVANPALMDVTPVATDKLFVLGRRPGQTNLVVLDDAGNELLNTPVLVQPQNGNSVTVNRGTAEKTLNCTPRCSGSGPDSGPSASGPASGPGTAGPGK